MQKNTFHEYSRSLLGKQEDGPCSVLNVPEHIVNRLIDDTVGTNKNLTSDNWYISYPLVKSLSEKNCVDALSNNDIAIIVEFQASGNRDI
jgi:hypothetical protein